MDDETRADRALVAMSAGHTTVDDDEPSSPPWSRAGNDEPPRSHRRALGTATTPPPPRRVTIALLGRFEVTEGTRPVEVPPGLPTDGIKFVAAHGGRVRTDALTDALWPDAGLAAGRKGIRNLISRLNRADCPLLVRDGPTVRVPRGVRIDATAFQTVADRVLYNTRHPGAADGARLALEHYVGDLVPDDLHLEWAEPIRERLRRRRLALIDLLASDARRRGARREAMTLMELAIEIEPYDDLRYLEVAEMLLEAGRRGRAAVYVHRSLQVLREYGLRAGPDWVALQRQVQPGAGVAGPRPADATVSPP